MYWKDFFNCMDLRVLVRNKKAAKMAFITILVLIMAFAVLIWYIFYTKKLAAEGAKGVEAVKDVLKTGI